MVAISTRLLNLSILFLFAFISLSICAPCEKAESKPLISVLSNNDESGLVQSGDFNGYHASGINSGMNSDQNNTNSKQNESIKQVNNRDQSNQSSNGNEGSISILSDDKKSGLVQSGDFNGYHASGINSGNQSDSNNSNSSQNETEEKSSSSSSSPSSSSQPLISILSGNEKSGLIQSGTQNGYHASGINSGENSDQNNTNSQQNQTVVQGDKHKNHQSNQQDGLSILSENQKSGLIQSGTENGYHASGVNSGKNSDQNNTGSQQKQTIA